MKFKKLRMAWSVLRGILGVLFKHPRYTPLQRVGAAAIRETEKPA